METWRRYGQNEEGGSLIMEPFKIETFVCSFNYNELEILINSVKERAQRLLNLSCDMSQTGFRNAKGDTPTIEDIRIVKKGSDYHFELVEKIRNYRDV